MVDVARVNEWRGEVCGGFVCGHLSEVARGGHGVRSFAISALSSLIVGESGEGGGGATLARDVTGVEDLFRARRYGSSESLPPADPEQLEDGGGESKTAANLFEPLLELLKTDDPDLVEEGILNLQGVLEKIGQRVDCWDVIIMSLHACEGPAAFKCLKFIVSEFLGNVGDSTGGLGQLINTCESYAFSNFDVNTSLTAISLIWSISDREDNARPCLESLVRISADVRPEVSIIVLRSVDVYRLGALSLRCSKTSLVALLRVDYIKA